MNFGDRKYVPTLAIRPSEMNALEFLPGATKDRMTPCILLAPWANSNTLERAIDRVERAFPNRNYFLDIDRDYRFTNLESAPQQELTHLMDPANGFANWVDFVEQHVWVWPCVQTRDQNEADLRQQIAAFQELERPYFMRIVRDRFPGNIDEIISAFSAGGTADFAIILEGGWTTDPLSLSVWFQGILSESLQAIDASVPIILSCTSMPKIFTRYEGITPVPFNNRQLVEQISRSSNRTTIIYGDWGSTRPREHSGFANRPWDRIDYPTSSAWYIVRNKNEEWDFETAAKKLVERDDIWDGNLNIWGEEMIFQTTINEEIGIDTAPKNVAARVNIHLHRQAFFDYPEIHSIDFDEDWED
ncbi:MAG: beta family protein [Alphaproteobacteria bacterium]|nr:beta family protein [Alphaproteobacteria bacterium]MCB9931451.1 beta family protein [Alphaproteobacteria bacterium]